MTLTSDPATLAAWRPRYHVTGERNWINDPNGPIQHDGVYHLFYQANPQGPFWGPPSWGHVTSTDLVHWTRQPVALRPGVGGPDDDGCWSGCAYVIDGRAALYYTGVVGADDARVESVCRAWGSDDLLRWVKDVANPLLPAPPAERASGYHRDPFLWRDRDGWHMLLGSGTIEGRRHGQVLCYESRDATAWEYAGVFFEAPRELAGVDLGEHWECPQLLRDGDRATLIVSCQAPAAERPLMHAAYFSGALQDGRFTGSLGGLVDFGDVFYAPAVCHDDRGRVLLWGWAQERVTAEQQAALTHVGALSLPRSVALRDGDLTVEPVPELECLRRRPLTRAVNGRRPAFIAAAQMELTATAIYAGAGWRLDGSDGESVTALIDGDELVVTFAEGVMRAPLRQRGELRVFVDGSLLEVFAGGSAVTARAYPARGTFTTATPLGHADAAAWELATDALA